MLDFDCRVGGGQVDFLAFFRQSKYHTVSRVMLGGPAAEQPARSIRHGHSPGRTEQEETR